MTNITKKWLIKHEACCSKEDMDRAEEIGDVRAICHKLLEADRFDDANWLFTGLLNKDGLRRYSINAAEAILSVFENEFPEDKRPRLAIEAAKKCLKHKSKENKPNTAAAYTYAAIAFTHAAAAYTYARAAYAYAVANTPGRAAVDTGVEKDIINYGLKLLYKE
jgi:hypothetical protein